MAIWTSEIQDLENLYNSIKGQFPVLGKELGQLIKTEDENVILLYSRRCLEIIITDLCECELKRPRKTEPLQGIIDKLNKEEKVPSHIIASMHGLNTLATFGTHPKDFDPEQVKPVLVNLGIIIKWYLKYKDFLIPEMVRQEAPPVTSRLPEGGEPSLKRLLPRKIIAPVSLGILLILAIIYLIPKLTEKAETKSSSAAPVTRSIAVLPVLNFTGDPDLGWIADMIQSDLTGQLQTISTLIVRPRQTTMQFRNSDESVQDIAQKLNVNSLIEASVKGTEDNLQLEIRVVEAFPEEKYLYSSSFNQSFRELTNAYNDIIKLILKGLKITTTEQEKKILSVRRTANPDVRRACARGLYNLNLLTEEGVQKGIQFYKDAIAIDPGDPEPYIGLAMALSNAGHMAGAIPEALQQSRAYALKAIELDPEELHPNIGDAHVVLSQKYFCYDYDFEKAVYHLNRGLQLNPNSPLAHYLNGWYNVLMGQADKGADEMKKAVSIDPLNLQWSGNLAWMYQWVGRYDESLVSVEKPLSLNSGNNMALYVKGLALSGLGRHEEAIELQKKTYQSGKGGFSSGLGVAYALAGETDKAVEIAHELEAQKRRWLTFGLAEIYCILKDYEKTFYWLEEAYRQKHDFVPWIGCNVNFKPVYNDKRFIDLINRLNLPD
jgi:adenylate cyclase